MTKPETTRLDWALRAAVVLLVVAARLLPGARTIDDAFITFRYSRHLVEGQGFVYNLGEWVLGTTTPLFTLVMAAISTVTGGQAFPQYAIFVSAVADAITAVLLMLIMLRLTGNRWPSVLIGILWALAPQSVSFAIGGMETSLNILWMVSATWFMLNGRTAWMGVCAGLGVLTRIDSLIWIVLLFGYQFVAQWRVPAAKSLIARLPLRTWLAFGLMILPWFAFSLAYFGSLVPRSLSAKSVAYAIQPGSALVWIVQRYATPFFEFDTFGGAGAMLGAVFYPVLGLVTLRMAWRRNRALVPFLLYPWLYMLIFSVVNPLMFRWYIAPPLPALMTGIVAGAWLIWGARNRFAGIRRAAFGVLTVLWLVTSLSGWTLTPDHGPQRPAPKMAWHEIELAYEQVGNLLREKYGVTPQTLVASADIGAVGYFSRATILDTVGLVSPQMSKYYPFSRDILLPGQNYAVPPRIFADFQPEYFVTMEGFVRLGLERDPQFKARYGEPVERRPFPFYGTDMRIYQRR